MFSAHHGCFICQLCYALCMKNISINLLTNVVLLLAGLMLIIFHDQPNLLDWVARVIGIMFLLPSIAYLVIVAVRHSPNRMGADYLGVLPAVGGLCFGVLMLVRPQLFGGVLSIFMAVLLIVLGLFHIIYLFLSRKAVDVKGWYYLLPLTVAVFGLLILFADGWCSLEDRVVLITGIGLLMFNVTSLQESLAERRARRDAIVLPHIDGCDDCADMTQSDDSGQDCDSAPGDEKYLHVEV